jgi:hypothetical protein
VSADQPQPPQAPEPPRELEKPALTKRGWTLRSAPVVIVAVALVAAAELAIGAIVYGDRSEQTTAIVGACGGILLLAVIDLWLRPRTGDQARRLRRFLAPWALVPAFCVIAASMWTHYQQWTNGLDDISIVARDVGEAVCPAAKGCKWTDLHFDEVQQRVDTLLKQRADDDQFQELSRVIAADLLRYHGDRHKLLRRAKHAIAQSALIAFGVQCLFVLWIPLLLALKIHKAVRACRGRPMAALPIDKAPANYIESVDARDRRIMGEDHAFFVPRLCFAALLILGTNYVFAPYGIKASYVMNLVNEHSLPGHPAYALWSTSFAAAPVIVVGFVGFLVYAMITATQRFMQDDLDDTAVMALLVRGLVVVLLSFALSSSPVDGTISRLFVFIAGVFPVRALEAIGKRVNVTVDPDFETDNTRSFDGLPSLDPAKVFALRAAGIQSTYDLAAIPIETIAARVRIDPRLLGRAVDRAILIEAVGLELANKLAIFAINTATELVNLNEAGLPEPACKAFGEADTAAKRVAERLKTDPRVAKVQKWLDDSRVS